MLTILHFGEYIESTRDNWFYIAMNPYHIIGIIAFSTLIYASLVTGLVWLGMSLFYSMICIYAAALWLVVSMQQRAKQECAGRDRRYRTAEISHFGSRFSEFGEAPGIGNVDSSAFIATESNSLQIVSDTARRNIQSRVSKEDSVNADSVHLGDVREYVEHLGRLRGAQRRSIARASSASATRSRAGFNNGVSALQKQSSLQTRQTSTSKH